MLSSIRPYGLPAEPARQAPTGRPTPGPAEVPVDAGRTAPAPKPAPTPMPLPVDAGRTAPGPMPAPTPTPVPTDSGRTAPAVSLRPAPAGPDVSDTQMLADAALRFAYRADGRASEGPPPPTGQFLDRRG